MSWGKKSAPQKMGQKKSFYSTKMFRIFPVQQTGNGITIRRSPAIISIIIYSVIDEEFAPGAQLMATPHLAA